MALIVIYRFFSFLLFLLFVLVSCSEISWRQYNVSGPDEFIAESSFLQEGKIGIQMLNNECVAPLPGGSLLSYEDVIYEDDLLNVALYHPSRFDLMQSIQFLSNQIGGFQVKEGMICLPDIQPVVVAGLTLSEAKEKLTCCYREQVKDVEIFLSFKERSLQKVEITGLTERPFIPVDGRMRLYEVLALAHLSPQANLHSSYVIRDGVKLNIDFVKLLKEGDMSQNVVMRGGDKIYIAAPNECCVFVMGEVLTPGVFPLYTGSMSLREALLLAHGIPFTGNKQRIHIIRGNLECPKIFIISWNYMLTQPNENLLLMPNDIVYVSQKPITQWNLFLKQLEPSLFAILNGYAISSMIK